MLMTMRNQICALFVLLMAAAFAPTVNAKDLEHQDHTRGDSVPSFEKRTELIVDNNINVSQYKDVSVDSHRDLQAAMARVIYHVEITYTKAGAGCQVGNLGVVDLVCENEIAFLPRESAGGMQCSKVSKSRLRCQETDIIPKSLRDNIYGSEVSVMCLGTNVQQVDSISAFMVSSSYSCDQFDNESAITRSIGVSRVCNELKSDTSITGPDLTRMKPIFGATCSIGGGFGTTCGDTWKCSVGNPSLNPNIPCRRTIPPLSYTGGASGFDAAKCLNVNPVQGNPTALARNSKAEYEVEIIYNRGLSSPCDLDVGIVEIICDGAGKIGLLPNQGNAETFCSKTNDQTLTCDVPVETSDSIVQVMCSGPNLEDVSLSATWTPVSFKCSNQFGSVNYRLLIAQLCKTKSTLLGPYSNHYSESCYPVSAASWDRFDFDGNGEKETFVEQCLITEASSACFPRCNERKMTPLTADILPTAVDTDCLVADLPVGPVICFPGSAEVAVQDERKVVTLDSLMIGDYVMTAGEKYERVYGFGHLSTDRSAEYLQIFTDSQTTTKPLELSSSHMVFVSSYQSIPASLLRPGDSILASSGDLVTITAIRSVIRRGLYAPFTSSGSIVVNGMVASTFVAFNSAGALTLFGGRFGSLSYQFLAHVFETPHRVWCTISSCENETYTLDGISNWVNIPLKCAVRLLRQHSTVRSVMLSMTMLPFLLLWGLETYPLFCSAICCAIVAGSMISRYLARNRTRIIITKHHESQYRKML